MKTNPQEVDKELVLHIKTMFDVFYDREVTCALHADDCLFADINIA